MATSQNGWLVLDKDTTGEPPRLRNWVIPGVKRQLLLRDGSAGFLLVHLAHWYHSKIERVDEGATDDWGWAPRPIRGNKDIYSNHASGTAMDLNATKHPIGQPASKSFTSQEIIMINARLKFYEYCIRWGGNYSGRPDPMHFELVRGLTQVQKRSRDLCESQRGRIILDANKGVRAFILS